MESKKQILNKHKSTKSSKKKLLVKEGERLKKKKLFGCKVVKYWALLNISNPYTTDRILVKHASNGEVVLILKNSYDDEVKYALPKHKDGGFLLEKNEVDPKVILWVGTESCLKKIGYFLIFESENDAIEFYKFAQTRSTAELIEENGEMEENEIV